MGKRIDTDDVRNIIKERIDELVHVKSSKENSSHIMGQILSLYDLQKRIDELDATRVEFENWESEIHAEGNN